MNTLIILLIQFYWAVVPESKRRKCIFRISCSRHVYHTVKTQGFHKGLLAFRYRYMNCRSGFHIFEHPIDDRKAMILPGGDILTEEEISERFIK